MQLSAGALILLVTGCWLSGQSSAGRNSSARTSKSAPLPAEAEPQSHPPAVRLPGSEKLTFEVEWRLVHAGTVLIETEKSRSEMKLLSAGLVSSLFKVNDTYTVDYDEPFCASRSLMDSQEGKRHRETNIVYDRA